MYEIKVVTTSYGRNDHTGTFRKVRSWTSYLPVVSYEDALHLAESINKVRRSLSKTDEFTDTLMEYERRANVVVRVRIGYELVCLDPSQLYGAANNLQDLNDAHQAELLEYQNKRTIAQEAAE